MLRFTTPRLTAREAMQRLAARGVLIGQSAADTLRAVFHLNVDDGQTDRAIEQFRHLEHV
jgi:DNA-binding FadR family transcriptional regulator